MFFIVSMAMGFILIKWKRTQIANYWIRVRLKNIWNALQQAFISASGIRALLYPVESPRRPIKWRIELLP